MVDKEQVLLFTRGIPASGKSTYAKNWVAQDRDNRVRVNRDDIRFGTFGKYYFADAKERNEKEARVTQIEEDLIRRHLSEGKSVVSDNMHLNPKFLKSYLKMAKDFNVKVDHKDFPISLEEALRRNSKRDRVVDEDALKTIYARNLGPGGQFHLFPGSHPIKPFAKPEKRRHAMIVDMDGTLSDTRDIVHFVESRPGKKYRDFDSFHRHSYFTPPNKEVLKMVMDAHEKGLAIIITTARNEAYREVTQAWLDRLNVPYENMYMRADNDGRPDFVVKDEIYNTQIKQDYDVVRALDDNPQAVKAWQKNNIDVTVVPGFSEKSESREDLKIDNVFARGGCARCGKPLKSGALIGPRCAKSL